ncbi:MAG: PilT/PilU family type 4a pilus ATPase [Candidatus Omnitrophota bacterium]
MKIKDLLRVMGERDASDVFLRVDSVPYLRIYGELAPMQDIPVLATADLEKVIAEIADPVHKKMLQETHDTDFGIDVEGLERFRVSIFYQQGVPSIVMRRIKKNVPDFKALNLPEELLQKLCHERRGLVLLTGPAGSGKSTTIASMIEYINNNFSRHVLTIEDPIEYAFTAKKCVVNQRELGIDVASYLMGLRQVTLQSPDVVFIGTIRDLDTMKAALNAAEMGILVFSTLHTVNTSQTVQRILNFFPPHQHAEIRLQLSFLLKGVLSLRLVSKIDGSGRLPAWESMTLTPSISRLIREGGLADIPKFLEEGAMFGMESFKQNLARLVKDNKIAVEEAYKFADSKEELELEVKGIRRLT